MARGLQNCAGNRNKRWKEEETSEQREKLRRGAGECGSVREDGGGQVICPMMSQYVITGHRRSHSIHSSSDPCECLGGGRWDTNVGMKMAAFFIETRTMA